MFKYRFISICLILVGVLSSQDGFAQDDFKPTTSFSVSGKIKSAKTFTLDEIRKLKTTAISDITITNHKGDVKGMAKGMEGVLLKDVLASVEIDAESPKVFSEFYLVCIASDSYKVVYSWNELFNTNVGDGVFIVTSKAHQPGESLNENILMVSTYDLRTGRRYLKNLQEISIRRAQ